MKLQKRVGPGPFYLRAGRRIRLVNPGDIIDASEEFYEKHKSQFDRIGPEPEQPKQDMQLRMVARSDDGFDVVNDATGEPINDGPLTEEQATAIVGPDGDGAKVDAHETATLKTDEADESEEPRVLVLSHRGAGRYDVIDQTTGEPINEVLLTKAEAEALVKAKSERP